MKVAKDSSLTQYLKQNPRWSRDIVSASEKFK